MCRRGYEGREERRVVSVRKRFKEGRLVRLVIVTFSVVFGGIEVWVVIGLELVRGCDVSFRG